MKVTDPQGQVWRVTRRWLPWRRRRKPGDIPVESVLDNLGDGIIEALSSFLIGALIALLLPFTVWLVVTLGELVLVFLLIPAAVLARVFRGQEWYVEVRHGFTPWHEQRAGDWADSARTIEHLARQIRLGQLPPKTLASRPRPPKPGRGRRTP